MRLQLIHICVTELFRYSQCETVIQMRKNEAQCGKKYDKIQVTKMSIGKAFAVRLLEQYLA